MREELYRNVAMPPTFLWAPQIAAIANMALQMCIMFIIFALFKVNYLWFAPTVIGGHILVASYGAREPHLDKMMMSLGKVPQSSKNMYSGKGVKFGS